MGVMVRIPTPLRRMTGGADKVELEVDDLSQMIEQAGVRLPRFQGAAAGRRG